MEKVSGTYTQG